MATCFRDFVIEYTNNRSYVCYAMHRLSTPTYPCKSPSHDTAWVFLTPYNMPFVPIKSSTHPLILCICCNAVYKMSISTRSKNSIRCCSNPHLIVSPVIYLFLSFFFNPLVFGISSSKASVLNNFFNFASEDGILGVIDRAPSAIGGGVGLR